MISQSKIRIWCSALLIVMINAVAALNAPAESWKQVIVKCSPEDLEKVRAQIGAAIVDAIPGHYLLTVPSTTDITKIEGVRAKGLIEADDNSKVVIQKRAKRNAGGSSTTTSPTIGGTVNWNGTPARAGYATQPAVSQIQLHRALNIAKGAGIRVAIIDTGVDEKH